MMKIFLSKINLLSTVIFVKGFVSFVVLQVIRLQRFLFDSTESFAKFAHEVVLLEVGGDVVLPEQHVHLLHLLVSHAQCADPAHRQLPLAQAAIAVKLDRSIVLGTNWEGSLDTGLLDLLPVQAKLLTQLLSQPHQPFLGHGSGHLPVAGPHNALLGIVLLDVLVLGEALGSVHVLGGGSPIQEAEAPVTKTRVPSQPRELHRELLLLDSLELRNVQRGVKHPELHVAVEASVGTCPLWVNLEGARLFRHHSRKSLGPEKAATILQSERIVI